MQTGARTRFTMTEQSTLRQFPRGAVPVVLGSAPLAFVGCGIRSLASGPGANASPQFVCSRPGSVKREKVRRWK